jgi:hypothetical protein
MSEKFPYDDAPFANFRMRETAQPAEDLLKPGTVIELADSTQLSAFEDLIAQSVDPNYNPDFWLARPKLRDLIRPPKFNGTIANIKLEVIGEPYERLLDARERGWQLGKGPGKFELSGESAQSRIEKYKGFSFTADAKSSGRGVIGQIQAELFYYPVYDRPERHYDKEGKGVTRILTKPKIERERFIQLDETSRRIGFEVLKEAMKHPMRG